MPRFLCDTCRYCHPSACSNPERPNATKCRDYGKTGGGAGGTGGGIGGTEFTVRKLVFLLIALLVIIGFILLFVLPY